MKNKFTPIILFTLILSFFSLAQEKENPLIRMDLLKFQKRLNESVKKRNIFSWKVFTKELVRNNESREQKNRRNEKQSLKEEIKKQNLLTVDIKYIGFISSKKKILGILLLGKDEIIVKEGDIIENVGKVNKITTKEIELILDDSKTVKIPIEEKEEFIF